MVSFPPMTETFSVLVNLHGGWVVGRKIIDWQQVFIFHFALHVHISHFARIFFIRTGYPRAFISESNSNITVHLT